MYREIMVATDAGDLGQRAAEHAMKLAQSLDATIHVIAIHPDTVTTRDRIRADPEQEVADAINEINVMGDEMGVPVTTEVRQGDPCDMIVDYADERNADLIIMGTTPGRALTRLLHGSTTLCVSRNSTVPVMTVGEQTQPILPDPEHSTHQFHCPSCDSRLRIDAETKGAIKDEGCIFCGAEVSEGMFTELEA